MLTETPVTWEQVQEVGEKDLSTVTRPAEEVLLARWAQKVKRSQLQEMLFAAAKPAPFRDAKSLFAAEPKAVP
jgi:hypothetical protein